MTRDKTVRSVMLFLAVSSSCIFSATAAPLNPTGQWVVTYADSECVLQRSYGDSGKPPMLEIHPQPLSEMLKIHVIAPRQGVFKPSAPMSIGFGSNETAISTKGAVRPLAPSLVHYSTAIRRSEFAPAMRNDMVSFRSAPHVVEFAVPAISNAMKALDECVADLVHEWGLSRERQAMHSSFAVPEKTAIISPDDYPNEALLASQTGRSVAVVDVDSDGRASNCRIVKSSKHRLLDEATCKAMLRSKFRPALDRAGAEIKSIYVLSNDWLLAG